MRQTAVPYLEPIVAAAWFTVGAAALDGGVGTLALAGCLALTVALLLALHRRHGRGSRLPAGERGRFLRTVVITVLLIAVSGSVLGGYFYLGGLVVPVGAVLVGLATWSLSSVLDERSWLLAGASVAALGVLGVIMALDAAGRPYPQAVVGFAAGAVFALAGAYRGGLLQSGALTRGSRRDDQRRDDQRRDDSRRDDRHRDDRHRDDRHRDDRHRDDRRDDRHGGRGGAGPRGGGAPYRGGPPPVGPARRGDTRKMPLDEQRGRWGR